MRKNNQKGFTLVLSLVLLLVMSLMGGALIVIASGDHQSNNTSCLLYTSPSPRDIMRSRMPSSA